MKSIEDLCEKLTNGIVFGKGLRKTAARTLSFLSEAVSGESGATMRSGAVREKEPRTAQALFGELYFHCFLIVFLCFDPGVCSSLLGVGAL